MSGQAVALVAAHSSSASASTLVGDALLEHVRGRDVDRELEDPLRLAPEGGKVERRRSIRVA
jgi:hypothetical protein